MDTSRKRSLVGLSLLIMAALALFISYHKYNTTPWTRHGEVMADIIKVAPRVNGQISQVLVKENQSVNKGELLILIDPEPYQLAVEQAEVKLRQTHHDVEQLKASIVAVQKELEKAFEDLQYSRENSQRIKTLRQSASVSQDAADKARKSLAVAEAEHERVKANLHKAQTALGDEGKENIRILAAQINVKRARLDLSYTSIKAPADGFVVNVKIAAGDYGQTGKPLIAVVDKASLRITAMFRENQLQNIDLNDQAQVILMAQPDQTLTGKVQSIGTAIAPPETTRANDLVPSIPTVFDWVRLPQRVPVIVLLDPQQSTKYFIPGMTASVTILLK